MPEKTQFRQATLHARGPAGNNLSFNVLVPWVQIEKRTLAPGGDLDISGLGDVSVYLEGWMSGGWSLLAGVKLPTGEDAVSPGPGLTPPTLLQLGSGTFDPMVGMHFTGDRNSEAIPTASLLLIQPIGESDGGLHPGRSWRLNAGGYWNTESWFEPSVHLEVLRRDADELNGARLPDTGATLWSLVPALNTMIGDHGFFRVAWRIPLDQEVEGTQLVPGSAFTIEAGWNF